jgi:hypothetical protein
MNCRVAILGLFFVASTFAFGVTPSRAQDEPQTPPQQPTPDTPPDSMPGSAPKPAGYAFPGLIGPAEGELQPDFSPLTGMQNTTLGFPEMRHSYWVPGLQFSSTVQSSPYGQTGSGVYANNYFIGNLSLLEAWSRSTLAINYSGGGFVSTDSAQGSGMYQQLAISQNFRTERWLLQILDQFAYIPQSSFGFGGGTGLGIPGVGGSLGTTIPGLGGNYTPNQSVYGVGAYYNNTGALQATYALTHRSSITLSGSYGLLSFVDSANSNSNTTVGSIGYNYALSRNDTIGVVYRFSSYQFPGNPQAYGDNVFSVAYGRKLTGHLAMRLFVGPDITNYRIPVGDTTRTVGVSASANVTYGLRRGGLSLAYNHGFSAGSGVLIGSQLDQVTATATRNLTRVWTGSVNFGYSRNSTVGGTPQTGFPSYSDWFLGGSLGRPIGRNFNFAVAYTASISNYSQPGCVGAACTPTSTYQTGTINFMWHPRPFVLR